MNEPSWIAFANTDKLISGTPKIVAEEVKNFVAKHPQANVIVFDATTSKPIDMDGPGILLSALSLIPATEPAQPSPARAGRPKLGVVAREITLLPRHWEWLSTQPGGASVALRKLVEQAQRDNKDTDRIRIARESTYRFMSAMAGNEQGFEEATRALFAGNLAAFRNSISNWPQDIREHTFTLAKASEALDKDSESDKA